MVFPVVQTSKRPDLIVWNEEEKVMKGIGLTVSWETNIEGRMKDTKTCALAAKSRDGLLNVLPIEVGDYLPHNQGRNEINIQSKFL